MTLTQTLTGNQKVAVALMQMTKESASAVMQRFTDKETEMITAEIVRIRRVDPDVADEVMTEFYDMVVAGKKSPIGGADFATSLLEDAFGSERAAGVMDKLATTMAGKSFEFLDDAEPGQIVALLDGELPQTIALVLAHLKPKKSSSVMAMMADTARTDIAQAIAVMGSATPEAITISADILKARTGGGTGGREQAEVVGGVQPLVEIINRADAAMERALMDALEERDPELAEEIRSRMLTFADLVKLEARAVQLVLRGVDASVLALAMKGAKSEVVEVVRANVSERNREILESEIQALGAVRTSAVEEARAEIVRQIREMEAQGHIEVRRNDDDDAVIN
ncbi:flagellar motor switch protein FliG [Pseudarthrobacter sp. BIM B-2242]|uniref:flagellar motor switch protein FliG n=1 Tax=Pseudarthrobacter sp. BIM B-2242 TaxID=2772401 RepID=UPI00168B3E60|nr:flagellar motor switch protein FliG [Pseudarthrobacter sp. BIM B-2242]QOD05762.1 flagellar motor switch protein FliG [Pseudarthrobacter sp. BIM B-2242]